MKVCHVQIIQINLTLKNAPPPNPKIKKSSNNTNKLSPQEPLAAVSLIMICSNNTNKLSPQEPLTSISPIMICSNNTNKLSPQEHKPAEESHNSRFK